MGSRIVISLRSLLSIPGVNVKLSSEQHQDEDGQYYTDDTATVGFTTGSGENEELTVNQFDYTAYEGRVELSKDFNFFRDREHHSRLLRVLYEHSISFTVHH